MRLSFFVVFTLAVCYGASIENHQAREPIVWQDEFEFLDINKWKAPNYSIARRQQ
jgi:hypothetical protein